VKRVIAVLAAVTIALAGCTAQPVATTRPASSDQKRVAAGSSVRMKNGFELTVPVGWAATLTVDPSPDGPLHESEYFLLESLQPTDGPEAVMVFSSAAATIPVSALDEYGRDSFSLFNRVGAFDVLVGQAGTPYEPKRLMAARAQLPKSQIAVLFFAGDPQTPPIALDEIWHLFSMQGQ